MRFWGTWTLLCDCWIKANLEGSRGMFPGNVLKNIIINCAFRDLIIGHNPFQIVLAKHVLNCGPFWTLWDLTGQFTQICCIFSRI